MIFGCNKKVCILISLFLLFFVSLLHLVNHPHNFSVFSPEQSGAKVFGRSTPCPGSPTREKVLSCLNQSCSVLPLPDLRKEDKRLPGAIIIGAKKGGTSTLITMLSMHSRIQSQGDEAHFFDEDDHYAKGWDWYLKKLPVPSSPDQIIMEKSPRYFVCPAAPLRIHAMSPNISLLLIVRDPVTRLVSDFTHWVAKEKGEYKGPSFEETVISPDGQVIHNHMVDIGLYFKHLEQWLEYFPMNQIHVVDGDQLINAPWIELEKAQRFLGLKVEITKGNFQYNEDKGFYCMKRDETQNKTNCMSKGKGRAHDMVSNTTISKLRAFYKPHNRRFYEMVSRTFGWPEF